MATGQTHGGKGSAARPTVKKKYEDNYDVIFGKKKTGREEPCGSELLQRENEKKERLAIAELVKELMLPLSEQLNIRCNTP